MVKYLLIVTGVIAANFAIMGFNTANAGIWDDVKTIVGGHTQDLVGRVTKDDMLVDGMLLQAGMIDVNAVGQDAAHNASGSVFIILMDGKRYVQLGTDFTTGFAPDLHVYVSKDADIMEESDFNFDTQRNLGKLTKGSGASYYEIPDNMDIDSVTIWCKRFGAYMGSATLTPVGDKV